MKTTIIAKFDGIHFAGVSRNEGTYLERRNECYAVIQELVYNRLGYMPDTKTITRHMVRRETQYYPNGKIYIRYKKH
ncbi:MAG: hypothetical protein J6C92_00725 [Bacteroidaceae bacterium]|nr:hypothetical protein [Bacteroidaceae bacterium]